jgi:uncharacterized membrane protein
MVAEKRIDREDTPAVRVEDLVGLRSRVSWAAVFAGAVLALAIFFVLSLLGASIGLSVYEDVNRNTLNYGAAAWAIISLLISLFLGGWFVSQATVGENKCEAAVHGILMWGVFFALTLGLTAMGIRAGFNSLIGAATIAEKTGINDQANVDRGTLDKNLRDAGFNDQQIAKVHETLDNPVQKARDVVNDPQTRENVKTASWWTLFGVLLSMAAALVGALVGAGPTFRLMAVRGFGAATITERRETVRT